MSTAAPTTALTEDEAALYDRQIRLWGVETQNRMRSAAVLLAGLGAASGEAAKNVVLAGVGRLVVCDHLAVQPRDLATSLFLTREHVGVNRAVASVPGIQEMNPMVKVEADTANVCEKPAEFFAQFAVVVAGDLPLAAVQRLDAECRRLRVPFLATETFGFSGYVFSDLDGYTYSETVVPPQAPNGGDPSAPPPAAEVRQQTVAAPSLEAVLAVPWGAAALRAVAKPFFLLQILDAHRAAHGGRLPDAAEAQAAVAQRLEAAGLPASFLPADTTAAFVTAAPSAIASTAAVVGGVLSQEIIKLLSAKDWPLQNFFFYDALGGAGLVDCIVPPPAAAS